MTDKPEQEGTSAPRMDVEMVETQSETRSELTGAHITGVQWQDVARPKLELKRSFAVPMYVVYALRDARSLGYAQSCGPKK
jgi:hypothetical protein